MDAWKALWKHSYTRRGEAKARGDMSLPTEADYAINPSDTEGEGF